ncbi:MAG: hypothetical protein P8Y14_21905 [Anaerolineales bacterium]
MSDLEPITLNFQVKVEDADEEELDQVTRRLLIELRDQEVESVELERSGVLPEGAKGEPVLIGSILVKVAPVLVPPLLAAITSWIDRSKGRSVKVKLELEGKIVEFEGTSGDLKELLQVLAKSDEPPAGNTS